MGDNTSHSTMPTLDCPISDDPCEPDGVVIRIVEERQIVDSGPWFYQMDTTIEPGSGIRVEQNLAWSTYEVHVEAGTIALTASVPVECSGSCTMASGSQPARSGSGGTEATSIPVLPDTEVLLGPGDSATFNEDSPEANHVYRNAGPEQARLRSAVTSPPPPMDCRGRCVTSV